MVKFLLSVGADADGVDPSNSPVLSVVTTGHGADESRAEVFQIADRCRCDLENKKDIEQLRPARQHCLVAGDSAALNGRSSDF